MTSKPSPSIKIIPIPGKTPRDRTLWVKNYLADRQGMDAWRVDLLPDVYVSTDKMKMVLVQGDRDFKERYAEKTSTDKLIV